MWVKYLRPSCARLSHRTVDIRDVDTESTEASVSEMTAVGFEPTPLRTGALSQRLRPLGQTVLMSSDSIGASNGEVKLQEATSPTRHPSAAHSEGSAMAACHNFGWRLDGRRPSPQSTLSPVGMGRRLGAASPAPVLVAHRAPCDTGINPAHTLAELWPLHQTV